MGRSVGFLVCRIILPTSGEVRLFLALAPKMAVGLLRIDHLRRQHPEIDCFDRFVINLDPSLVYQKELLFSVLILGMVYDSVSDLIIFYPVCGYDKLFGALWCRRRFVLFLVLHDQGIQAYRSGLFNLLLQVFHLDELER